MSVPVTEWWPRFAAMLVDGRLEAAAQSGKPHYQRLVEAVQDPTATHLDCAILLRQALRRAALCGDDPAGAGLHLPLSAPWTDLPFERVAIHAESDGSGLAVRATPWRPDWLADVPDEGVDATAMAAPRRRQKMPVPADPIVRRTFGHEHYTSIGQRDTLRAALATPPGGMLLVDLPTGDGKSLIFNTIAASGFIGDRPNARGVTLVVVPTVTLAIDHAAAARLRYGDLPLAHLGGSEENVRIRAAVAAGEQPLVFAAPESVVGALRRPLEQASDAGLLRAVVLDEAHLIDAWGSGFRSEFQLLPGMIRDLVARGPAERRCRTVLLSATLTPATRKTLADLFSDGDPLSEIGAPQVRTEPEWWVARAADEGTRRARVLEALRHLPRPAILYVTTVEAAGSYFQALRCEGFGRLRLVTGATGTDEREAVMQRWRSGRLDLVVGTSAFGLGVDYGHVRSVVHACVPESFDRFYQEVGRGGRDGRASLSLIVPSYHDIAIAKRMAEERLISVELGLERWNAMFNSQRRRSLGHPRWALPIDEVRGAQVDLHGERNKEWNVRTLTSMARSGLIRLHGLADEAPPDGGLGQQSVVVEIRDENHRDPSVWQARVEPRRQELKDAHRASLGLMRRFLKERTCPADLIAELYGEECTAKACGGCGTCRAEPWRRRHADRRIVSAFPWHGVGGIRGERLRRLLGTTRSLVVSWPSEVRERARTRRLRDTLETLVDDGIVLLEIRGAIPPWAADAVNHVARVVFAGRALRPGERVLPPGPRVVLMGDDCNTTAGDFAPRPEGRERIVVTGRVPDGWHGWVMPFDEFRARYQG